MNALGVFDPDIFERGEPWKGGLPLDLYTEMRDERPCYWQALDAEPLFVDGTWVVSRHEDCVRIIKDTQRFSNQAGTSVRRFDPTIAERGGRPTMVTMDGAEHQRNRTVTSRLFAPRAVAAWAGNFRKIAVRIVERALDLGTIDFITDLACYMPLDAISEMLGIPPEDREQVLRWTNMMTVPLDPHYTPTRADFEGALHGLWDYGLTLAERRRAEPDDSVMTAIAAANADGRLSDAEVQGYMLQLAAAGNETTRNAIAFGLHALLLRPAQMELLRSTGGMPDSAVEEIIRWSSPTLYTIRQALEPIELHGVNIPAGARIALMQGAANFDPAVFDRPQEFDVMRAHNPHLGFGIASHVCLGIHVARLELRIMFEELLARAKTIELDGDIAFVRDSFIHGVRTMPVRLGRA